MRGEPKVSVIIIFLNAAKFINEAIQSVLAQTWEDWELLLVDDGSIDLSTAIARDYTVRFPGRISYLEHDGHANRGMSSSRNLGIRHSRAPFIAFLDSDDIWLPNKLERQVAILESQPAVMVCGTSQYWYGWTGRWEDAIHDHVSNIGVPPDSLLQPPTLLALLLSGIHTPCPSNILLRRDAIERIGGFEESFTGLRQLYEDQAFLSKLYLDSPVFVSNECWDRYRIHGDSCDSVAVRTGRQDEARMFFLHWLRDYVGTRQVDHAIRASLSLALEDTLQARGRSNICDNAERGSDLEYRCLQWWLRLAGSNRAALEFLDNTGDAVRVKITRATTHVEFDIQLNLPRLALGAERLYELSFTASAEHARSICVGCSRSYPPWDNLGLYRSVGLTPHWQTFVISFSATSGSINARIHFDVGQEPGSVAIRNVRLLDVWDKKSVLPDQPARIPLHPFDGEIRSRQEVNPQ
jgi:glycosyltransferase involved in cell wall biosynthesis